MATAYISYNCPIVNQSSVWFGQIKICHHISRRILEKPRLIFLWQNGFQGRNGSIA